MATELPDISKEALEAEKKNAAADVEGLEIEVVDDTPPEDRNREPLPKEMVRELEEDDLEEYSDKVKKRLSQMKKVWHDERREKERAARERDEVLSYARMKDKEIQDLRQRFGQGEKLFVEEVSKAATTEIAAAKDKLKRAYESGDADLIADAQEALTDAKLKLREIQQRKPALQEREEGVETQQREQATQTQVQVDPKATAWRDKNTWFGVDEEMTALALGLHEKLVRSGVDPRSDDYYKKIDATIRKRFPEQFEATGSEQETTEPEPPVSRKKPVVAAVTRTTAPNKVRLTGTQIAIAKRLGLTPEAYAKEVVKLENANG